MFRNAWHNPLSSHSTCVLCCTSSLWALRSEYVVYGRFIGICPVVVWGFFCHLQWTFFLMSPSSGLSLQTPSNFIFLTTQTTFDTGSCIFLRSCTLLASMILCSCFSVVSLLALSAKFMGDVMEYELGIQSYVLILSNSYNHLLYQKCLLQMHRMFRALSLWSFSTCNHGATDLL